MNLNNKYLAIGLAVAAVCIVSYQLFFNKTEDNKPVPLPPPAYIAPHVATQTATPSAPQPEPTRAEPRVPQEQSDTAASTSENALVIDFNSEILLKRIQPEMAQPAPPREIEPDFGYPIFVKPAAKEETPVNAAPVKEVEFVLNGIIIDSTRRLAIVNDTILKIGDVILGAQITAIVKNKVILKLNQQEIVLSTDSKIQKIKLHGGTGAH